MATVGECVRNEKVNPVNTNPTDGGDGVTNEIGLLSYLMMILLLNLM